MAHSNGASGKGGAAVWDVVICGGGLAGLLLARQLRRELPDLTVAVVERTRRPLPDACHKVGESSVELGSQYLERLGLVDYLLQRHLVKLGLRFFPGGGHMPLAERAEVGPCAEPIVRSYQLDRGRLEGDLRGFLEADGVTLLEGARVREIALGSGGNDHVVNVELDSGTRRLAARWVVDATGRAALLRRRMKMTRGARYIASAGWFRVAGRLDINQLVPAEDTEWMARPCAAERWRSTNHLMGEGYWAWLIPLSTGHTSVGLVIQEETHDAKCIAGLDRVLEFFERHEPYLARALDGAEIKDFLCLRNYAHQVARCWSEDRWALVGEAGAFVDPLYSPGTDFIALANSFTVEMIRTERAGGDLQEKATMLNAHYRSLVAGAIDLFRQAAPVYGHPGAMAAKVYWDNFLYWGYTCQYAQQQVYRLTLAESEPFTVVGRRFLDISGHLQGFLRGWAQLAPEEPTRSFRSVPTFPSVLIDAHVAITAAMSPAEALTYVRERLSQGEEIAAEIVLRVVQELGPARAQELLERVGFQSWGIAIPPARLEAELSVGRGRRKQLPPIARDMERTLGRVRRHPEAAAALELIAQGAAP